MLIKIAVTEGLILIHISCDLCVNFVIHHFGFMLTDTLAVGVTLTKIGKKMGYGARAVLARIDGESIFPFFHIC